MVGMKKGVLGIIIPSKTEKFLQRTIQEKKCS